MGGAIPFIETNLFSAQFAAPTEFWISMAGISCLKPKWVGAQS